MLPEEYYKSCIEFKIDNYHLIPTM